MPPDLPRDAGASRAGRRPRVVVAVPTFRRPALLELAVGAVLAQAEDVRADVEVLVIDNDPAGGAREAMAARAPGVRYRHEPRPGLAAVRNRALDESAGADALVFVDDDEIPRPGWLAALVDTWQSLGCSAVAGPALKVLPPHADPWVRASGHFDARHRTTGTVVRGAATNNLLLDRHDVDRLGLRFDERFGTSGGEDTLFTRTLSRRGGVVVWCDEARVDDPVPDDRATRGWVLRRQFRTGTTWSRVHVALAGTSRERLVQRADLTVRGLWSVVRGGARYAAGTVRGSLADRARGECAAASGTGVLLGVAGLTFGEYARPRPAG